MIKIFQILYDDLEHNQYLRIRTTNPDYSPCILPDDEIVYTNQYIVIVRDEKRIMINIRHVISAQVFNKGDEY